MMLSGFLRNKMFQFKIDNAHRAYALMKEGWPTKIVSLVGPDLNFELPSQGDHHMIKVFHDFEGHVEPETLEDTVWELKHPLILPTMEDMYDVLAFCGDLGDEDRLLIHCHAGRSRSAAMLIGIIYDHTILRSNESGDIAFPDYDMALKCARNAVNLVAATRPTMIPNRLMIKYLDEIFAGVYLPQGVLNQAVKEYWDNCTLPGIMLRTKLSGWKDD
jgi:hypothetical protein